jgi:DNA-binding LytR/AlgR family response regulator
MFNILIVEDEILIADTIKRYLLKKGYNIVGIAISFEEALELIAAQQPDLILLDIRLSGEKTGIDIAAYIKAQQLDIPYIFLTSQLDKTTLDAARETFPAGYLSKPIQKESLYATIEITMHSFIETRKNLLITLQSGNESHAVRIADIQYLAADHVYIKVYIVGMKQPLLVRQPLKELLDVLPAQQFVQTHRSFAINLQHISSWDRVKILIGSIEIPISRANKEQVMSVLNNK